jgi:hypothetical protein
MTEVNPGRCHEAVAAPGGAPLFRLTPMAFALAALAGALTAGPAAARPAYLKAMAEHYGPFLPARLNNCSSCHMPSTTGKSPTSLADFPHTLFGKRVMAARGELGAAGKRNDIAAVLKAIAAEDADGDGVANEPEILAGHLPGDAKDRPTPAELAAVAKRRPQLLAYWNAYRWRPFEPVKRPAVPQVKDARWIRNPIDAFIAAEREKQGLAPRPEASKAVLLRRVYLDLIGLSPTPEELHAFLADKSSNAYEKVVDRLLASPAYGERWGRHWMDVWRYSDWTGWGEQVRDSQPHIWRWRDWIVESLNADKGYDRMVTEMLAADEAYPEDANALRATGYLVRSYKLLSREQWLQETVDHTGQAFLGLTVGCARCHDHRYDPITQKEYYRLRAVFEPHQVRTDWVAGELDTKKNGLPRVYDANPDVPTYLYTRGDERQPVKDEPLAPGIVQSLGGKLDVRPVSLPLLARVPEKQPQVIAALRAEAAHRVEQMTQGMAASRTHEERALSDARLAAAQAGQAALEAVLRVEQIEDAGNKSSDAWKQAATETVRLQRAQAAAEARLQRLEAAGAARAAAGKAADEVKKATDALAAAEAAVTKAEADLTAPESVAYKPRVTSSYPATSTGRRLALARWITSRENPLAARVAMNHLWLRHFGVGLVPSPNDFGQNGSPPTHPQLLDWLASEFMSRDAPPSPPKLGGAGGATPAQPWQMKAMHRLVVTSATYRMASTPEPAALKKDPDNRLYWRMNSRRMDAEIVRDNVLYVAGQLDATLGGPDIDQNLGLSVKRRSLYFRHAAEKEMVFLTLFDGPSPVECYRRKETIIPQQALALANSELTLTQARLLARSLNEKSGPDAARFVGMAFERVLARPATAAETAECVRFLTSQPKLFEGKTVAASTDGKQPAADPTQRAREDLVMVLLNHHDFVTIR